MSTSKFSDPFMMKSPVTPLQGNAFIKAKMDAESAGKSSFSVDGKNYPLKMETPLEKEKDPREKVKDTIRITKPTNFKLKKDNYIDEDDFENQFDKVEGDASTFPQYSVQDYSKLKKDKKGFYVTKLKDGEYND
jgi:hypothetical protein